MPHEDLRAALSAHCVADRNCKALCLKISVISIRKLSVPLRRAPVCRAGLCPKRAPEESILHCCVSPPSVSHGLRTKAIARTGLCTSHSQLWEEEIRSKDRRLILGSALRLLCRCKQVVGHVTLLSKMRFLSDHVIASLYKTSTQEAEAGEL